jgi:hypothetical protein
VRSGALAGGEAYWPDGVTAHDRTVILAVQPRRNHAVPAVEHVHPIHANAVVVSEFLTTVMVGVRIPAVFVVLKVGHVSNPALNVTEQPTAAWTIQQFRVQIARGEPFIVGRAGTACPRCARKAGHRLLIVSKVGPSSLSSSHCASSRAPRWAPAGVRARP